MRATLFAAFGCLLLAAACADPEPTIIQEDPPEAVCGNGTLELGEVCDGATLAAQDSCVSRGFADGQIGCTSDCQLDVTACIVQDEDQDGLLYHDELAAGSDPTLYDTDGDGLSDGIEVTNGSDPLNAYSWPPGMWPNRLEAAQAAGLTGEGTAVGQVRPNFVVTDQFGEALSLHQLYGYVVVVSVGAVWCGPCNLAAQTSEAAFQKFVSQGVVFVEVLIDGPNPGKAATASDIEKWVLKYGLTFPVARTDNQQDFFDISSLPTFLIFDRDMQLNSISEGWGGDAALEADINNAIFFSDN
ncbi:MAG: redoxin domain-containing protein [Myxococcales bacterium]|nr:redoxin domain-containing protein [Myxococcales bacterium]